ncbi:MAG TPA: hypothetical protein DDY68_04505, partial [Porphyromonadaceae bacterium]|nr:hypothetical protein [Porphyromonadaceae bacterium]
MIHSYSGVCKSGIELIPLHTGLGEDTYGVGKTLCTLNCYGYCGTFRYKWENIEVRSPCFSFKFALLGFMSRKKEKRKSSVMEEEKDRIGRLEYSIKAIPCLIYIIVAVCATVMVLLEKSENNSSSPQSTGKSLEVFHGKENGVSSSNPQS